MREQRSAMGPILPARASLDRLLALLIALELATGALTLGSGTPSLGWVYAIHEVAAGALVLAIAVKVRRSLPPALAGRRRRLWVGLALTVVALVALGGGFAWVAAGRSLRVGPWTVLTLHAWAGLLLVPVLAVHLLPRRHRLLRAGPAAIPAAAGRVLSRRGLLAGIALSAASLALYSGADLLDRALGGERRFTGSRPLEAGGPPPPTTFLGEPVPAIDLATWRLRIRGAVARDLDYSRQDLGDLAKAEREAILDCTSGWALGATWAGVPLSVLLGASGPVAGASSVTVISVTGWRTELTLAEAEDCLLATSVASRPLPAENGAPCRLVVPQRRGVDWVKWVTAIEVG